MYKLLVLGTGPIVPFHLDALRSVGFYFESLYFHTNHTKALQLKKVYGFKGLFNDLEDIGKQKFDAILLATSAGSLPNIISILWKYRVPILVEKPVSISEEFFKSIPDENLPITQVGYNRRFYSSVNAFLSSKNDFSAKEDTGFIVQVPENSSNQNWNSDQLSKNTLVNTIHMIDLLFFLFGKDLKIKSELLNGERGSFTSLTYQMVSDTCKGIFELTNGVPARYNIETYQRGVKLQLKPLEYFRKFNGMRISEPSKEMPVRSYQPQNMDDWKLPPDDTNFKPGFLNQSRAFYQLCSGGKLVNIAASLEDAKRAINFAEKVRQSAKF